MCSKAKQLIPNYFLDLDDWTIMYIIVAPRNSQVRACFGDIRHGRKLGFRLQKD